jgi:hypothetical protein
MGPTGIMILGSGVDQRSSAVAVQEAIAARARAPWRARGKRSCAIYVFTAADTEAMMRRFRSWSTAFCDLLLVPRRESGEQPEVCW